LGLQLFTLFHVVLRLVGIIAGLVVAFGFTKSKITGRMKFVVSHHHHRYGIHVSFP
jgi:hypothetical protein